ncbi:mannonate dehydratase [Buttiauxella warmboldiae]|uniref:Mannonate dehydratase n=1 Tax=Buttiauxella warmboldiae TaxID=82993 RepID=A0A3N5ECB6_9ENTR|nr:mannonate dehydratase [Buttiauxella warmboldiae]RPH30163.1 mannonate dehydratase [Buttiauxella warmboldiae]
MLHSWRWFGPDDPVTLEAARQAGATDIVTALHHISNGDIWSIDEIQQRKKLVSEKGMTWSVVESVPLHETIKTREGEYQKYIDNYKQTIKNLAACGIYTICYNFLPVLDWVRTDLDYLLPNGAKALRFDYTAIIAFDLFVLKRDGAYSDYSPEQIEAAKDYFKHCSPERIDELTKIILAGLPGSEESYTIDDFRQHLKRYAKIGKQEYRENLKYFLHQIIPVAESVGVKMGMHPDDPPFNIFGLHRIFSNFDDMQWISEIINSTSNGFTLCTGSYGVRSENDIVKAIDTFGDRIHFLHLRSTKREACPMNFYEAPHLEGDIDMVSIISAVLRQESKLGYQIPMRPDHGHQMLDDLTKKTNPGYSAIGRLKGLAELRGIEFTLHKISH